jgi:hypothetical protein
MLYVSLLAGLSIPLLISGDASAWILLGVTVTSLAMFILGAGHRDLCRPIRRPRLVFPIATASFMLACLLTALTVALSELYRVEQGSQGADLAFWITLGCTWLFWAVVLFVHTRNLKRLATVSLLARLVFAGSIAELLATVPSHIIVSRRGGCFAGIGTGIGILAGLCVMLWSFGPGIFLLFLQETRRSAARPAEEPDVEIRRSRRLLPFQYSLQTLLLAVLLTGVGSGLLRAFWGYWPAAAFSALMILVLLTPLLVDRPRLRLTALVLVQAGVVWALWGNWSTLISLALPTAILGILLAKALLPRPPAR